MDDLDYNNLIRMLLNGHDTFARFHIYGRLQGVAVVDFVENLLVAATMFHVPDEFYTSWQQVRTTTEMDFYLTYWARTFTGHRWA